LKIGVVGWGEIGRKHATHFASAGAKLGGVVSSRKDLSISVPVFERLENMLPHVDAVTIAVPNHLHARLCIEAIEAGKAVMVEKPICINSDELSELKAKSSQLKAPVHVGYRLRFNPEIRSIRERIGRPKRIACSYRMGIDRLADGKDWTRRFSDTGGSFFTLGIHMLDLCRWLGDARLQPLEKLTAKASHIDSSADYPLNVSLSGILPDGTELVASTDLRGDQPSKIEIAIDYDSNDVANKPIRHPVAATDEDIEYKKMISAFVEAAKTGTANCSYFSEVLITHRELIEARNIVN
jgi:UDP-N-acetyl-2-amino-2-deoxyglucuronate dehydrogenase